MFDFLKRLLSGSNESELKRIWPIVDKIESMEPQFEKLSADELRAFTAQFKDRYKNGESLDSILPEAFAVVREGAKRVHGQRAFRTQLMGGIVLHQGRIAEMRTGEGKTLTAAFPAYLNALTGEGVHIVTVNDYLARFHSELIGNIFRYLGVSVGLIVHDMQAADKQKAYGADVTYATNNELGFDYLRDNMVIHKRDIVQRPLNFAIIDEVDSILIDEARTPLIISGQGDKSTELYARADQFVPRLKSEVDYTRDEKQKTLVLTEDGVRKVEQGFNIENLTDIANTELHHHVLTALKAHVMMKRDVDYVVQNGEVVIVDEFTGRLMTGRRYSDGLHQAIEAKEHVKVMRESKTLATITFQNYFRMYKKLSGMTGTARTEEEEFQGIYKLDVVTVPTNKPMIRDDMNDAVYINGRGKESAVVEEIIARHQTGQPILVGTVSVEKSEDLSKMLEKRGIKHVVLNAKFHDKEAEIVAQAGKKGAVTIATNMAGRGTDIILGGNAEFIARHQLKNTYDEDIIEQAIGHNQDVDDEVKEARKAFQDLMGKYSGEIDKEHEAVVALGGLHIIGTERHESRRIDNQLRGRAGRQGDPGSSQFFISLDDDLMRLFGSDRVQNMVSKIGVEEDQAIEFSMLSKQIENAQKRIESRNYDIRKNVLQFDDVMNQQRGVIYSQRQEVLEGENIAQRIVEMRGTLIEDAVNRCITDENNQDTWDIPLLSEYLERICIKPGAVKEAIAGIDRPNKDNIIAELNDQSVKFYDEREKMLQEAGIDMREFERVALLGAVDRRWMDHIDAMDTLRDGIGLRAYGQRDPFVEYRLEGYEMFDEMVRLIQEDTLRRLYFAMLQPRVAERVQVAKPTVASHGSAQGSVSKKPVKSDKKVGRNDPCPCGSGKKFKECCGK